MTDPTALPPALTPEGATSTTASIPLYLTGSIPALGEPILGADAQGRGQPVQVDGSQGEELADTDLRVVVYRALLAEGITTALDDDGDLGVSIDDQVVFIRCVPSQPPMIRAFAQWLLDPDPSQEVIRLRAANEVTGSLNLVKAAVHGDRLLIAIDLVVADGLPLGPLASSAMQAVLMAARTWRETVTRLVQMTGSMPVQPG